MFSAHFLTSCPKLTKWRHYDESFLPVPVLPLLSLSFEKETFFKNTEIGCLYKISERAGEFVLTGNLTLVLMLDISLRLLLVQYQ